MSSLSGVFAAHRSRQPPPRVAAREKPARPQRRSSPLDELVRLGLLGDPVPAVAPKREQTLAKDSGRRRLDAAEYMHGVFEALGSIGVKTPDYAKDRVDCAASYGAASASRLQAIATIDRLLGSVGGMGFGLKRQDVDFLEGIVIHDQRPWRRVSRRNKPLVYARLQYALDMVAVHRGELSPGDFGRRWPEAKYADLSRRLAACVAEARVTRRRPEPPPAPPS